MKNIFTFLVVLLSINVSAQKLNPDVKQSTIDTTICVTGYTKTVRPSTSYTNGVKIKLMLEQDISRSDANAYELDHIVPLTLGGHPRLLGNLQLQPWDGSAGAKVKDKLEVRLNKEVCSRNIKLADAQACIYKDWKSCALRHP